MSHKQLAIGCGLIGRALSIQAAKNAVGEVQESVCG